ncbi:MAG: LysM peptidoglycan-binding domain-containing protein [Chloroflexota bacterium]
MKRAWMIATVLLLAVSGSAIGAQDETVNNGCGFQVEVARGDSLFVIAQRCGVTVDGIREFNPGVTNLIQPGDILFLPTPGFEVEVEPAVTVSPRTANNITTVAVDIVNFPSNTGLRVGVGLPGEVALDATETATNAQGSATASFTVPNDVPNDALLFVTAVTVDNALQVTSPPFTRTQATNPTVVLRTNEVEESEAIAPASAGAGGGEAASADTTPAQPIIAVDFTRLAPSPAPVGVNVNGTLFDRVNIYLAAGPGAEAEGIPAGCGEAIVPVQVAISQTVAPLTASIDALLEQTPTDLELPTYANPSATLDLEVDQVAIINGEARIALTGELASAGACTDALILAQMAATALQYATVDSVSVTVDGLPLGSILDLP